MFGSGEVRERFPAAEQLFHFFQGISKLISSSVRRCLSCCCCRVSQEEAFYVFFHENIVSSKRCYVRSSIGSYWGVMSLAGGGVAERKWKWIGTWSIFLSLPCRLMRSRKSTVKSTAGRFPHPSHPRSREGWPMA